MESSFKNRTLFDEITVGDLQLPNRIMMAALTRMRADPATGVPNDLHVQYYSDRADFGIILTECSQISPMGEAFPGSCGVYSDAQVQGWRKVVDQVHEKGGRIFNQIWHCGRATDSQINKQSEIWAPSAIAISTNHSGLKRPHQIPKEMTLDDIKTLISQFRKGAENCKKAGFDGIELHGAHGYIIDQFLQDAANQRKDAYGGSVENRSRLCLEVIDQIIQVYGAKRVGIKLSPCSSYNDGTDSDPVALYTYLIQQLDARGIAFIEINQTNDTQQIDNACEKFRSLFKGVLVANFGYDAQTGLEIIQTGSADMVSFGQLAIHNPDLINRIQNNYPTNTTWDFQTFYTPGEQGYTDYPTYEEEQAAAKQN